MAAWNEIVVEGTEKVLRAFVLGFAAGHPGREAAILGTDVHLAPSSFHERLRDLFVAGSHHLLVAPAELAASLAAALRTQGEAVGLRVAGLRAVELARLAFSFEAFSPRVTGELREQLFAGLPTGVRVVGFEEREEQDPTSAGTELYSPAHTYTFKAAGSFVGPLPGVLEMQRRARALEFVKVRELELETRELAS